MKLNNNNLLIIMSAVLLCSIAIPLHAERHYVFPDEVINRSAQHQFQYAQDVNKKDKTQFSAQQRYWTYPQYISDFDNMQPISSTKSNSAGKEFRYPGDSLKQNYAGSSRSPKLIYPGDLDSKKQAYNHDKAAGYGEYKTYPRYPSSQQAAPLQSDKYRERHDEQRHDRYKNRYKDQYKNKQGKRDTIVRYKYIAVPVYGIQRSAYDSIALPEILNNRGSNLMRTPYHSPEKFGVFSRDTDLYNLSPRRFDKYPDLDPLIPQLGSIDSEF